MTSEENYGDEAVVACARLVSRAGATRFVFGYLHDDVPISEADWYAEAWYRGYRLIAEHHRGPGDACDALARRILQNGKCRCGKRVALSTIEQGCYWSRTGEQWSPSCTADSIPMPAGVRGNIPMMEQVWEEHHRGR